MLQKVQQLAPETIETSCLLRVRYTKLYAFLLLLAKYSNHICVHGKLKHFAENFSRQKTVRDETTHRKYFAQKISKKYRRHFVNFFLTVSQVLVFQLNKTEEPFKCLFIFFKIKLGATK